jgi:sugar transferase (PEP-CTERM system associated)
MRVLQSLGVAAILMGIFYIIFPKTIIAKGIFVISVSIVIFVIACWRLTYAEVLKIGLFDQNIILLGSAELVKRIKSEITVRRDCGYKVALEVPEDSCGLDLTNQAAPIIVCEKNAEGICEIAKTLNIKKIIVALQEKRDNFPVKALLRCRVEGIDVIDGNTFYEMLTGKLVVDNINPSWFIFSGGFQKSALRRFIKRAFDIIFSLFLIVIFFPLAAIIAILIKIDSKGPVFFSQERVGEKDKLFLMHKFRSMVCDAEKSCGPVWASNDDDRITRIGRLIRKMRFDELPQLWNVLKGEMSFVGPRPEREFFVKQLEEEIPYYKERHTVKPGITGWAQVCFTYGASVDDALEKLNYDLFYIKNMSVLMDFYIVLRTIKIVLFGRGAR